MLSVAHHDHLHLVLLRQKGQVMSMEQEILDFLKCSSIEEYINNISRTLATRNYLTMNIRSNGGSKVIEINDEL